MRDVLVVGDSPAALAAALELAEVGLGVTVSLGDRAAWPTGAVRDPEGLLGIFLTRVAQSISGRGAGFGALLPEAEAPRPMLMRDKRGEWAPVPEPSILGIPAVPASEQTVAFLPGGAAVRAYLDRVKPLLTIGKTAELGRLVRERMGAKLQEALVEPLVRERFGIGSDAVDTVIAVPGLNEVMSRAGSLSGAVFTLQEEWAVHETLVRPAGGWEAARLALLERLALYDVVFEDEDPDDPARAIVVDAECEPERAAGVRDAGQVAAVRAFVTVPIEDPGLPVADAAALTAVALPNGESWSVRIEREDGAAGEESAGGWLARLSGPRTSGSRDPVSNAAAALGMSALTPTSRLHAEQRTAPFASVEERDAAEQQLLREREADPERLVVGRSLHGGETSQAVTDALAAAVVLRRHLIGIAE